MNVAEKKGSGPQGFIRIAGYLAILLLIGAAIAQGSTAALPYVGLALAIFIFTEGFATIIGRLLELIELLDNLIKINEKIPERKN